MSLLDLQRLISDRVSSLAGRVQAAADMSDMIRRQQLPQSPAAAFVLPLGLTPRSDGEAGAGAFTQAIDESFAVVLVVQTSGDGSGAKTAPKAEVLVWDVIQAVCGTDDPAAIGVYRLSRGRLIEVTAGAVFYQLDFAIQRQIRVMP